MTTKLANTAYLVRAGTQLIAFVSTPFNWIRTHWCVLVVPCSYCGAKIGEPCTQVGATRRSLNGLPKSSTHWMRRADAKMKKPDDAMLGVALSVDVLGKGHVRAAVSRAKDRKP